MSAGYLFLYSNTFLCLAGMIGVITCFNYGPNFIMLLRNIKYCLANVCTKLSMQPVATNFTDIFYLARFFYAWQSVFMLTGLMSLFHSRFKFSMKLGLVWVKSSMHSPCKIKWLHFFPTPNSALAPQFSGSFWGQAPHFCFCDINNG